MCLSISLSQIRLLTFFCLLYTIQKFKERFCVIRDTSMLYTVTFDAFSVSPSLNQSVTSVPFLTEYISFEQFLPLMSSFYVKAFFMCDIPFSCVSVILVDNILICQLLRVYELFVLVLILFYQ